MSTDVRAVHAHPAALPCRGSGPAGASRGCVGLRGAGPGPCGGGGAAEGAPPVPPAARALTARARRPTHTL